MNIITVTNQILMLFIITGVGWFLQKRKVLTDPVIKGINSVVLQAAWPAMILSTTQKKCTPETLKGFFTVAAVSAAILALACGAICLVLARRNVSAAPVYVVLSVMPNAGFVGLPIIQAVYGDTGLLYLAAFLVGFNLILWTVGVFLFTGVSAGSLRGLLNPGLIAAVVGTLLFVAGVALPAPLLSTVNQLGALTTPLSMLLLGARLPRVKPQALRSPRVWSAVALKLLALPTITLAAMRLLRVDAVLTGVAVLSMAMPAASAAQMLAEKYDDDVEFSVQGVSASMLLCIVTVPLIVLLLSI